MTGQPARSPLPRSAQPHAAEPDVHHITVQRRRRTILGEQRDLPGVLATLVKCFDGPAPRRSLAIVDLAQIQHVPLHRSTAANPAVLYDAPVAMFLTVLAADLVAQKHAARLSQLCAVSQATWSAPQTVAANHRAADPRFSVTYLRGGARKSLESRVSSESRAKRVLRGVGIAIFSRDGRACGALVTALTRRLRRRGRSGGARDQAPPVLDQAASRRLSRGFRWAARRCASQ